MGLILLGKRKRLGIAIMWYYVDSANINTTTRFKILYRKENISRQEQAKYIYMKFRVHRFQTTWKIDLGYRFH